MGLGVSDEELLQPRREEGSAMPWEDQEELAGREEARDELQTA